MDFLVFIWDIGEEIGFQKMFTFLINQNPFDE